MSRTVQLHQHSSCTPATLSNPLNPATCCLFSSNNNSFLCGRSFLCCRLPVGYNFFSTHRYAVFCSFGDKAFPFLFKDAHTWSVRLQGIFAAWIKAAWVRVFLYQFGYLTVGSRLFLSVLCCTYIVCPASQLIHPLFLSKQGHLEQLWLSVVLLGHSLCNINWRRKLRFYNLRHL